MNLYKNRIFTDRLNSAFFIRFACILHLASCIGSLPVYADLSSAQYRIAEESFTSGGGGNLTSASYKIDEGFLSPYAKAAIGSTNYSLQGKVGIDSTSGIPIINSVTPGTPSRHYTDESPSYTVSAVSPDAQVLTYDAKQDAALKDGPQDSNVLTWALTGSDRGKHAVSFNISDATGAVRKDQAMYAFRRPVK